MSDGAEIAVAKLKLGELLELATNETVRVKLRNISDTCEHLVVVGKQRLTVPLLLATYAVRYPAKDHSIAESSIRNSRAGGNPYRDLYRVWFSVAEEMASPTRRPNAPAGDLVCQDDLAGISDAVLRHRVSLLVNQNRSLKSQLDIIKKARNAPVVRIQASHPETVGEVDHGAEALKFLGSEMDAIRDFLAPKRMASRGLALDDQGVLLGKDGRTLSDPGFVGALQKVLDHFGRH